MSRPSNQATVILSVDLAYSPSRSFDEMAKHDQFASVLRQQLRQANLTALWSVADPSRDELVSAVHAEGHEAGILADRGWWVPGINAQQLDRQLTSRIGDARSAGMEVVSVASASDVSAHYNVLQNHGVKAVRTTAGESAGGLQQVAEGLWSTPASCHLPAASRWSFGSVSAAKRVIKKTTAPGVTNVVFDLVRLASQGNRGVQAAGAVIQFIHSQCNRGVLRHRRLEELVTAAPQRAAGPMKSVLRAA